MGIGKAVCFMVLLLAPLSARAQETVTIYRDEKIPLKKEAAVNAFPDYEAIDQAFSAFLTQGVGEEEYVLQQMGEARKRIRDREFVSADDLRELEAIDARLARAQKISHLVGYDRNFDGAVTEEEVLDVLKDQLKISGNAPLDDHEARLRLQVGNIMENDADHDGRVDYAEMAAIGEGRASSSQLGGYYSILKQYMKLDSDHDGKVTVLQIGEHARKLFRIVDLNGDAVLSKEEMDHFDNFRRGNRYIASPVCPATPVPDKARLAVIALKKGDYLSSVSLAGVNGRTGAVKVRIEKQNKPLYLLLHSEEPTIFDFSGDLKNVKQVITSTSYFIRNNGARNLFANGVVNLPPEKVTMLPAGCVFKEFPGASLQSSQEHVVKQTGRMFDVAAGSQNFPAVKVYADYIEISQSSPMAEKIETPPGMDPEIWRSGVQTDPGGVGVLEYSPGSVMTSGTPMKYNPLPGYFGIASLVRDGVLVRKGPYEYDIVKRLDEFPLMRDGNMGRLVFTLTGDVLPPKGGMRFGCVKRRSPDGIETVVTPGRMCRAERPVPPQDWGGGAPQPFIVR